MYAMHDHPEFNQLEISIRQHIRVAETCHKNATQAQPRKARDARECQRGIEMVLIQTFGSYHHIQRGGRCYWKFWKQRRRRKTVFIRTDIHFRFIFPSIATNTKEF